MPNLKDIRTRIASVKNTQKITSAMKMVSAAKLRRAQTAAESARPYAVKMARVISSLSSRVDASKHPLLQTSDDSGKTLAIFVSSNRGLCGGFNSSLFRHFDRHTAADLGSEYEVITIGRKASLYFKNNPPEVVGDFPDVIGNVTFAQAKEIAKLAVTEFTSGKVDAVYLIYNEFVSAIEYRNTCQQILPLTMDAPDDGSEDVMGDFIFEPDEQKLLDMILPTNVETQVLRALLESEAAEHGARMSAMDNATTNANDMIESLTLQYNRARQAYITKELVEIVSGAEALQG